ncbi:hypothetical protein [Actinomadura meridiana]|uniref:hypothetical protein n=1 Tax=Actinomadura meridiana TaxID=559626 RepID=UPI0031EEA463
MAGVLGSGPIEGAESLRLALLVGGEIFLVLPPRFGECSLVAGAATKEPSHWTWRYGRIVVPFGSLLRRCEATGVEGRDARRDR